MPLRAKIILAAILGVVSIALIAVVIWGVQRFQASQQTADNSAAQQAATVTPSTPVTPTAAPTPVPQAPAPKSSEASVVAIVMPFVEGFGTYSNQSNFQNLKDLEPVMTPNMKQWADSNIASAEQKPFNPIYAGTTTKALAYEFTPSLEDTDTTATVKVSTQRKDSVGTSSNFKVYNQDVIVKLSKINNQWLVDDAQWQSQGAQ